MDLQYTYVPADADNGIACILKDSAYVITRINIIFNNEQFFHV